mgnify:CR=1 FL=1
MPKYDPEKYSTVAERMALLAETHPDYRIETVDYSTKQDRANGIWRVKAHLYLSRDDQAAGLPKGQGHAYEIDSAHGPQATSALEVCETSAIGRALMVAGFAAQKDPMVLASAEEMEKVARGKGAATEKPIVEPDRAVIEASVAQVKDKVELGTLWETEVVAKGLSQVKWIRDLFQMRGGEL